MLESSRGLWGWERAQGHTLVPLSFSSKKIGNWYSEQIGQKLRPRENLGSKDLGFGLGHGCIGFWETNVEPSELAFIPVDQALSPNPPVPSYTSSLPTPSAIHFALIWQSWFPLLFLFTNCRSFKPYTHCWLPSHIGHFPGKHWSVWPTPRWTLSGQWPWRPRVGRNHSPTLHPMGAWGTWRCHQYPALCGMEPSSSHHPSHHAGFSYFTVEGTSECHTSPPPFPPVPLAPIRRCSQPLVFFAKHWLSGRSSQVVLYPTNSHKYHIHHSWLNSYGLNWEGSSLAFRDLADFSCGVQFKRK